jgi:hypothetical protein
LKKSPPFKKDREIGNYSGSMIYKPQIHIKPEIQIERDKKENTSALPANLPT